jgi:putative DNA primase/helicase
MVQTVSPQQRFKRGQSCPICEGHAALKQGRGERCAGYMSTDGEYVYCTREEYAGSLERNEKTSPATFCHKFYGDCNCGVIHNPARATNGNKPHLSIAKEHISEEYSYLNERGRLVFQALRYEPKNFKQRRPDGKGGWIWSIQDVPLVPFHLPELLRANPDVLVFIPEGEKDVLTLEHIGLIATTNAMGAGKWKQEYNHFLKGRHVVLLPDNDKPGIEHVQTIFNELQNIAASVKILKLPGLKAKGADVSDWLAAGGTREKLEALLLPVSSGVLFSDIQEKDIKWLWEGWIPRGKITMEDGMPDQGKTLTALDIGARVTRDAIMPDDTKGIQGAFIVVAAEDDAADTIKPRLLAAHADVSKVVNLSNIRERNEQGDIEERPFSIPRDLPVLEEEIRKHGAVFIMLDPLMAILDPQLKAKDGQDVRQALTPLARLLERTECACMIIRHFNKGSSDNALLRGAGSMDIIGAARSGLIVVPDPDDNDRHVLALSKHNLSKKTDNLVYRIVADSFGRPKIEWVGASQHTTTELLSTSKPSAGRQEILHLLKNTDKPLGPLDIVEQAEDITYEQARQLLSRMAREGAIVSVARGKYTPSQSSQSSQIIQSSQSSQTTTTTTKEDTTCDDCDDCDEKTIVTKPMGLNKRCHICKRNEAVVWWPGDVPRCEECKEVQA